MKQNMHSALGDTEFVSFKINSVGGGVGAPARLLQLFLLL